MSTVQISIVIMDSCKNKIYIQGNGIADISWDIQHTSYSSKMCSASYTDMTYKNVVHLSSRTVTIGYGMPYTEGAAHLTQLHMTSRCSTSFEWSSPIWYSGCS